MLAAAASNIAVDNLVERLTASDPKLLVVRVGHPARLLPQVRVLLSSSFLIGALSMLTIICCSVSDKSGKQEGNLSPMRTADDVAGAGCEPRGPCGRL